MFLFVHACIYLKVYFLQSQCCWHPVCLGHSSYHCQGAHLFGGGDQGDPAERQQQRPGLSLWVWDVWHLLFCSTRSGEHHGRWGDQEVLCWGVGVLESVDPQQQQLPLHQPEADRPMGAGPADPLWLPAASQVLAVPQTESLFDIRRAPCSTQVFRKTEHIESGPRMEMYAILYK